MSEDNRSARRALRILKALKGHSLDGLSNGEIAKGLKDSPSNVTRALQTLIDEGFVQRLETGRFAHSVALLQIAAAHVEHLSRVEQKIGELRQRVAAGAHN